MCHVTDDVFQPNTPSNEPVAQGEELLPLSGFIREGIPQVEPDMAESHSKRRWISAEKISVGDNQLEAPPIKKCSFGQLTLATNNWHRASREEVGEVDKQTTDEIFFSNQDNSGENSFMNEEATERERDQDVFIQAQVGLLSNAEKPESETSLFLQDRNSQSSAPVESCLYVQRCEGITVHECDQDTSVKSGESLDLLGQEEDSGSERRPILNGSISKCPFFV